MRLKLNDPGPEKELDRLGGIWYSDSMEGEMKMRVTSQKKDLVEAVSRAQVFVPSRTNLAILKNLVISADNRGVSVTGYDLFTGGTATVGGTATEVQEAGTITASAKDLLSTMKSMPNGLVHLEDGEGGSTLIVQSELGPRVTLPALPAEEFPRVLPPEEEEVDKRSATIGAKEFVDILSRSIKTADPYGGATSERTDTVLLSGKEDAIEFVATNRVVLSRISGGNGWVSTDLKALIPLDSCKKIIRFLKKSKGDLTLTFSHQYTEVGMFKYMEISANGDMLVCTLANGRYPDYNSLYEVEDDATVLLDVEPLIEALNRAAGRPVLVIVGEDHIELSSEVHTEVLKVSVDGECYGFLVSPPHMCSALRALSSKSCILGLRDPESHVIIYGSKGGESAICMPMILRPEDRDRLGIR